MLVLGLKLLSKILRVHQGHPPPAGGLKTFVVRQHQGEASSIYQTKIDQYLVVWRDSFAQEQWCKCVMDNVPCSRTTQLSLCHSLSVP